MSFNVIRNFLLFVTLFGFARSDVAQYVTPCNSRDPQVNTCLKNLFNAMRPYLKTGLEELRIRSLEPLVIPQLTINNDNGNFRLNGKYKNVVVRGGSGIYITDVKSDIKNFRIDAKLTIPKVDARGNFDVVGQALLLPIRAQGDFALELTGVTAIVKIYAKQVFKNDQAYLQIDRLLLDYVVKGAKIKIADQLSPQLNEILNQFLNQNALLLVQETRAASAKSIGSVFKEFLGDIFSSHPLENFIY